jgi:hypothetical protein
MSVPTANPWVTSDKFTLRLHGSNSVNPSGWCDAFAGKTLLYDETARLTVLLRITSVRSLQASCSALSPPCAIIVASSCSILAAGGHILGEETEHLG